MSDEQAEMLVEAPADETQEQATPASESVESILTDALKGNQATPNQDGTGTEEAKEGEQTQGQIVETPFLELVVRDKEKLAFKNEDEFLGFLEKNQVLKDGWLRQADYTRKTQELSQKQKEHETLSQKEAEAWGKIKPDDGSRMALQNLWRVYSESDDPVLQDSILKFVKDVNDVASGRQPTGPLSQATQIADGQHTQIPEVANLMREVATLKRELSGFKQMTEQEKQQAVQAHEAENRQKQEQVVDSWIAGKEKGGVKLLQDELLIMADFMSINDEKGQPKLTLDEAYDLARHKLGKTKVDVTKTVIRDAKNQNNKTARPPMSRASGSEEPEAKDILGILQQGMKTLS